MQKGGAGRQIFQDLGEQGKDLEVSSGKNVKMLEGFKQLCDMIWLACWGGYLVAFRRAEACCALRAQCLLATVEVLLRIALPLYTWHTTSCHWSCDLRPVTSFSSIRLSMGTRRGTLSSGILAPLAPYPASQWQTGLGRVKDRDNLTPHTLSSSQNLPYAKASRLLSTMRPSVGSWLLICHTDRHIINHPAALCKESKELLTGILLLCRDLGLGKENVPCQKRHKPSWASGNESWLVKVNHGRSTLLISGWLRYQHVI